MGADSLSADRRGGKRRFQRCRGKGQAEKPPEEGGSETVELGWERRGGSRRREAVKARELPLQRRIGAVGFELGLPLPNGRSRKRNGDAKKALGLERCRSVLAQAGPYGGKDGDSMTVKPTGAEGTLKRIWLEPVGDADSPRRCARCPIGDCGSRTDNRPREAHGIELGGDARRLCGAPQPCRRESSLHLALRRKGGSATDCSPNGATARARGAERLPTDAKRSNPADRRRRARPYRTCRNRQFANCLETHMKRGAENG